MTAPVPAHSRDEATIAAFIAHMVDAWNRGSGEGFAAHMTDDVDFIAFEGTHLKGREQVVRFHQQLFDTALKGTRLWGEVKFVRVLGPQLALLHAHAGTTLAGAAQPSPSRDSMQLFVVTRADQDWRIAALLNARRLTLAQQHLADQIEALPPEGRSQLQTLLTTTTAARTR
jgi:uncharacterized protein (TIGR02246 family)